MEKLCIMCKHFYFESGHPGYSEVTPGYDATIGCHKNLITIDLMEDTTESYRKTLLTAESCPEYESYTIEDINAMNINLVGRYCCVLQPPRKGKIGKIVKHDDIRVHVQFGKLVFRYSHDVIQLCDEDYVGEPIIEPGIYLRGY